ncbi:hypothetical protein J3A64_004696 [Pseudarthrobacter sp. PvP004]|uniref:hypothetical protein n=1 Tax=Pseudarthrobacter sp. PvP004 TaxID=2817850 RepID=UPI001AE9FD89|nr:hypothetical protein [Pseudarthrobacter sp. PvP004]MBP2269156.1 hypothetical protein [Pseudarthrobacter sp. PvP004]
METVPDETLSKDIALSVTEGWGRAQRAARWFKLFASEHFAVALGFTVALDVFRAPFWPAAAGFLILASALWIAALRNRVAAPRHGMRNMVIGLGVWFVLYFLMFDPALQLIGASSALWWLGAGVLASSPFAACAFPSSRR